MRRPHDDTNVTSANTAERTRCCNAERTSRLNGATSGSGIQRQRQSKRAGSAALERQNFSFSP